jgi:hypothetical protein
MKAMNINIEGMKGEFLYRALVRFEEDEYGFSFAPEYFRSKAEVAAKYLRAVEILWPVDEIDRGVIYIPAPEEYQ